MRAVTENCVQTAPKNIEKDRRRKIFKKFLFTGEISYFLRFRFGRCRPHTVEVAGSNSLSPTTPSSRDENDPFSKNPRVFGPKA